MEQNEQQVKNRKTRLLILGVVLAIVALVGITYAFFNYTRVGTANTIRVGRISFNTTQASGQDGQITLTNVSPITRTAAASDTDNSGEVVITITGDTDYSGGVEYLVTATGVTNIVGGKTVPIGIIVTPSAGLGTSSDSYYTARSSAESHIYKVEAGDTIENNGRLLVGYIVPNSTPGTASGINGTLTIKAFIDKDKVAITDTYPEGTVYTVKSELGESDIVACTASLTGVTGVAGICDTSAHLQATIDAGNVLSVAQITALENVGLVTEYTDGTLSTWVNGRTVLTTAEWNSLISSGISFKVKVEANEGIWVENPNPICNKTWSCGTWAYYTSCSGDVWVPSNGVLPDLDNYTVGISVGFYTSKQYARCTSGGYKWPSNCTPINSTRYCAEATCTVTCS